jgi:CTP:molybdopterin cytidylyltransferase MocA
MTGSCGILLAAGSGRRFGSPKAELVLDGTRLVDRAVAVLTAAGCDEVLAVVRGDLAPLPAARVIVNPDPDRGMGSSLRLGLAAATGERAVLLLVDTPGITAEAVRTVLAADAPVAIGTYAGRRGHPVAFDRVWWDEIAERAEGDAGARAFLRAHPGLVLEVPCEGDPSDIDTADDLAAWSAKRGPGRP